MSINFLEKRIVSEKVNLLLEEGKTDEARLFPEKIGNMCE